MDNDTDKNLVGMLANQVPGIFEVTNDLRVVPVPLMRKMSHMEE